VAPAAPVRTAPIVKGSNCREPEFPPASERLGEYGSVIVALLVGVDGKVIDSRVEQSSGFPRLDQAALKGLTRCRFTPGTVDGVPESSWHLMRYTFEPAD
jgi:protein TonB